MQDPKFETPPPPGGARYPGPAARDPNEPTPNSKGAEASACLGPDYPQREPPAGTRSRGFTGGGGEREWTQIFGPQIPDGCQLRRGGGKAAGTENGLEAEWEHPARGRGTGLASPHLIRGFCFFFVVIFRQGGMTSASASVGSLLPSKPVPNRDAGHVDSGGSGVRVIWPPGGPS